MLIFSFLGERTEITNADLSQMTYLGWCIKESMRLFPPVPMFGRNLTKETKFGKCSKKLGTRLW